MASIGSILGIGGSALGAQQLLLGLIGQNIANANTPGYARQRLPLSAAADPRLGVLAGAPQAVRNEVIGELLIRTLGREGFAAGQLNGLSLVEPAFNDLDETGLGPAIVDLTSSLRELSANPGSGPLRAAVVDSAKALSNRFATTRRQLEEGMGATADLAQIKAQDATRMAEQIAALNKEIRSLQGTSVGVNELVAKRDALMAELGSIVEVQILQQNDGTVTLFAAGGRPLVEGTSSSALTVTGVGPPPGYEVQLSITTPNGESHEPLAPIGGELGGLLESIGQTMAPALRDLDQLAFDFSNAFNAQHTAGFDLNGVAGGDFFTPIAQVEGAAANLEIAAALEADPDLIAAAASAAEVPGGNGNLLALTDLLSEPGALPGGLSVSEGWDRIVFAVASEIEQANVALDTESASAAQLSNILLSEQGVSVDEELVAMTQANRAYEAAAQVIQAAQSMSDTLLNMVG